VNRRALDAAFRREKKQNKTMRTFTAGDGGGGGDYDDVNYSENEDDDNDGDEEEEEEGEDSGRGYKKGTSLATWRIRREKELREEAEDRWTLIRQENASDIATLEAQLGAINAISARKSNDAKGDGGEVALPASSSLSSRAAEIVTTWTKEPSEAAAIISRPRIRLPKIKDVLNQPSRSAMAEGWLRLLRNMYRQGEPLERLAPAYGMRWPEKPSATSTPPDHVVAIRSLRMGAGLIIEHGDAAQNPTNVVLCTLTQNSAKSDHVLGLFSSPDDAETSSGQDVYSPPGVSLAKKAMLAKVVAMVFGLYWGTFVCIKPRFPSSTLMFCMFHIVSVAYLSAGVTNKKRSAGIGSYYARGTGIETYARAWNNGPFKKLVRQRASSLERRAALLTAAIPYWNTCNALVFNSELLDDDLERLLDRRFRGEDSLSKLVDDALRASVYAAPR
jgi:hypothetical protein